MSRIAKWGLYVVAAYNFIGGLTALLDPGRHFAQMYTTALDLGDPLQLFFYRCVWINAMGWGLGYFLAARNAAGRVPILLAGGVGKAAYATACLLLYRAGVGGTMTVVAGIIDAACALFFAWVVFAPTSDRAAT
ncbi:MAG TPA: hypothetical protein VL295_09985 [Gemmatimonadales bacterium]|jgi:hypothetical protein|nr:hypothetical protein [Gemmatimonadales bacterium]